MQTSVEIAWMQAASVDAPPQEFLSDVELQKLAQMRFPRRREEWLLGRWTAKQLLQNIFAPSNEFFFKDWSVVNEPNGQPYVLAAGKRLPGCLSISHRSGRAVCAWTSTAGIQLGIDLEQIEPRSAAFVRDYFTAAEQMLVDGAVRERNAVLVWSAKEAMLKALGQGLRLDTRSVEVLRIGEGFDDEKWAGLEVRCSGRPELAWWAGWRLEGDWVLTVAGCGANFEPSAPRIRRITA